jgi:hypothetical protein
MPFKARFSENTKIWICELNTGHYLYGSQHHPFVWVIFEECPLNKDIWTYASGSKNFHAEVF